MPLGAWDGLRYFIVALPEPSIYLYYSGPVIWNAIPTDIKKSSIINAFVNKYVPGC